MCIRDRSSIEDSYSRFSRCLTDERLCTVPGYGDDGDGYYNVMTSSEQHQQQQQQHQRQQQQQPHSPAAGDTYRGVVSATTTPAGIDDEPTERELNLTLTAPPPPATHVQ